MIRINLLPGKKKPLILPPVLIYGVIGTFVLIIALAVFGVYLNKKVSAMENDIFVKEQKLNELKEKLIEVENYERDNQEFREKAKIIEQLKKNQIAPLILLDEVSEKLPKGVWLTGLTDDGGLISIEGYAHSNYDLVGYVQSLKGSKHLKSVMLTVSRQTKVDGVSVYKFKLTFKVKV
jgi:Tfp pilus assembly protein PilN